MPDLILATACDKSVCVPVEKQVHAPVLVLSVLYMLNFPTVSSPAPGVTNFSVVLNQLFGNKASQSPNWPGDWHVSSLATCRVFQIYSSM